MFSDRTHALLSMSVTRRARCGGGRTAIAWGRENTAPLRTASPAAFALAAEARPPSIHPRPDCGRPASNWNAGGGGGGGKAGCCAVDRTCASAGGVFLLFHHNHHDQDDHHDQDGSAASSVAPVLEDNASLLPPPLPPLLPPPLPLLP